MNVNSLIWLLTLDFDIPFPDKWLTNDGFQMIVSSQVFTVILCEVCQNELLTVSQTKIKSEIVKCGKLIN